MLTEMCPLDCTYCYIEDRVTNNEVSMEDIDTLVNNFTCNSEPRIIFFGGEPLAKLKLLEDVVEKYKDTCQFQVITSGLVNFEKFAKGIYTKYPDKFDIQISWDGKESKHRLLRLGGDRQNTVKEIIVYYTKRGMRIQPRCVLNDENITYLYNTYKQFKEWYHAYNRSTGDFTIAHQPSFEFSFSTILKTQLKLILADIKSDLGQGILPYIPQDFQQKMNAVLANRKVSSCDAGNYIVLKPDGYIYPCTILSQKSASNGINFNMGHISSNEYDWSPADDLRNPYPKESCNGCEFNSICDGGCRYERVINYANNWKEEICPHICSNSEVYFKTFNAWFDELTDEEYNLLLSKLTKFYNWAMHYDMANHKEAAKFRVSKPDSSNIKGLEPFNRHKNYG